VGGTQTITAAILAFQILSGVSLILFILLHAGRGGGLSEMFGGGISGTGGSTVVEKNLDRITVVTAFVFSISTIWLHFRIR
jgi:preprotein translocase subunit SecG